jgi:polyisoprenoid-binding protein YceI
MILFTAVLGPAFAQQPTGIAAGRYLQAGASGGLEFVFTQLGAASVGRFREFTTRLQFDEGNLASGSLEVTVKIASLDTSDGERDAALAGAELFDTQKHPTATYVASSLARTKDGGLEAVGKLTLRGVTRDLRLPFRLEKKDATRILLTGKSRIRRLDFGVGQGEWRSTESVADEVEIRYAVDLVKAP